MCPTQLFDDGLKPKVIETNDLIRLDEFQIQIHTDVLMGVSWAALI
jgi:hypothetical protein